ncbi:PaaI family thioesterase [Mariniflexile gromovii]|uniref:Medium/long-chain acyl-CoA thioesterase YigI n=1 Tax=Mariniflexile gromovii TaxID=362523 RepID=A0ABS4BWT7_9FLAO|nr:PaaI family thioesterase [Mariniflexile gromovii]MBP0905059.1 PaaI family thioesterase [Mariniflexile gromovii]
MNNKKKNELIKNFENSKLMKLFGGQISNFNEDYVEIEVSKKEFMMRPAGMFNGATIASLIDIASYASALTKSSSGYYATVELKINYLSPAVGDKLIAKANVIKRGKLLTVVRSDIFAAINEKENLVSTSLVTLMCLQNKSKEIQID